MITRTADLKRQRQPTDCPDTIQLLLIIHKKHQNTNNKETPPPPQNQQSRLMFSFSKAACQQSLTDAFLLLFPEPYIFISLFSH